MAKTLDDLDGDVALPVREDVDDELAPIFSRQIVIFTAIWLAINLVAGLTGFGLGPGELGQIAWQAHVGGYLAGLLLAGPFDRMRPRAAV